MGILSQSSLIMSLIIESGQMIGGLNHTLYGKWKLQPSIWFTHSHLLNAVLLDWVPKQEIRHEPHRSDTHIKWWQEGAFDILFHVNFWCIRLPIQIRPVTLDDQVTAMYSIHNMVNFLAQEGTVISMSDLCSNFPITFANI